MSTPSKEHVTASKHHNSEPDYPFSIIYFPQEVAESFTKEEKSTRGGK